LQVSAMSRAFVKDGSENAGSEELPERPQSPHPNYVTARGLRLLEQKLDLLLAERSRLHDRAGDDLMDEEELKTVERDLRYVQERIDRAIGIDLATQPHDQVAFGARVTAVDEDDNEMRFTIVGEDEADPDAGLISWVSPLARALGGATVGDTVVWKRPAGERELEIVKIEYPTD
jgi:transcription elongation GreA/GreB family factor